MGPNNAFDQTSTDDTEDGPIQKALLELTTPSDNRIKENLKKHSKPRRKKPPSPSPRFHEQDTLSSYSSPSSPSSPSSLSSSSSQEIKGMDDRTLYARVGNKKGKPPQKKTSPKTSKKATNVPFVYMELSEAARGKEGIDVATSCSDLSDNDNDDDLVYNGDAVNGTQSRRLTLEPSKKRNKSLDQILDIDEGLSDNNNPVYSRKKRKRNEDVPKELWCFGCRFGSEKDPSINGNRMNELIRIFTDNYLKMDNMILARLMHVYFKRMIWEPMKGKKKDMWRTREIYVHFTEHIRDPRVYIGQTIEKYKIISDTLNHMLIKQVNLENGSIIDIADHKNIKSMLDLDKRVLELYKTNPERMLFYNPSLQIDFSQLNKFVTMHKHWSMN